MNAEQLDRTFAMSMIDKNAANADWCKVLAWWFSDDIRPPQDVFPDGPDRQVALSLSWLREVQIAEETRREAIQRRGTRR
jgi:hypothetical protein